MCKPLEEAFQSDRLDFELDDTKWKEAFGKPDGLLGGWRCIPSSLFFEMRMTIMLLWLAAVIWSVYDFVGVHGHSFRYWPIYLTNCSCVLELVYFAFGSYTTFQAIFGNVPDGLGKQTPWFASATWLMGSLAPTIGVMVFVLYWVLVYTPRPEGPEPLAVMMHGGNVVLLLLDLLLCRQPYYLAHVYVPVIFATLYVLFTYVFYALGGKNEIGLPYIYKAVDWARPEEARSLLGLIVIFGVPLVYAVGVLLVLCRRGCFKAARLQIQPMLPRPAE